MLNFMYDLFTNWLKREINFTEIQYPKFCLNEIVDLASRCYILIKIENVNYSRSFMKTKFLLTSLLGITALVNLYHNNIRAQEKSEKTCKCYCSYKCGPRSAQPGDTPFYDEEHELCFCQMRDKIKYVPHGCNTLPKPNNLDCCKRQ
jgi:hypothetical protein